METIIEACKALDYSWLPQTVDGFTLVTSTESDYTILANRISDGEDVLKVPIFHYQNELGWRWSALYDKEVEDYTVHIEMATIFLCGHFFCASRFRVFLDRATRTMCKRVNQYVNRTC